MKIEDIFMEAEGPITLEQFDEIVSSKGAKFADLSEGHYVSVAKHEAELSSLERQIETLTDTLNQREADVADLSAALQEAGDDARSLSELTQRFAELQTKYDEDAEAYEEQLSRQAREFAVKEYAATKEFTSEAAKQFYIEKLLDSDDVDFNKKGELEGMEEFDAAFSKDYENTFYVKPELPEQKLPEPEAPKPKFLGQTPGAQKPENTKLSLSEMMQAKNENPEMNVGF